MTKQKIKRKQNFKKPDENNERWKHHDIYAEGACYSRVVTRSQIAFVRIKNTESDTELFADNTKHHPPGMPHLMTTLLGFYGAVTRTKITRRFAQYVSVSKTLCTALDKYKTATVTDVKGKEEIKEGAVEKDETVEKLDEDSKKKESKEEKTSGSWIKFFW